MSTATAKKPAAAKPAAKPAAKAAPKVLKAAPKPKPVAKVEKPEAEGDSTGAKVLRAKDLIARVAEATGSKVKDIKLSVEATLAEIGKALDAGEALNLAPLGKIKIIPAKGEGRTGPVKLKLHRGGANAAKKPAKEALAEDGEDS